MKTPTREQLIETARARYGDDGHVEVDDNAGIQRGDQPGAYVQAWVWISYEDVHITLREAA